MNARRATGSQADALDTGCLCTREEEEYGDTAQHVRALLYTRRALEAQLHIRPSTQSFTDTDYGVRKCSNGIRDSAFAHGRLHTPTYMRISIACTRTFWF